MPNHIRTIVKFKHLKSDDITIIKNLIAVPSEETDLDGNPLQYHIDFDKIIPEPVDESECPHEYIVNKDSHISIREEKPWFNWYKWHLTYWGTKWNAYDSYSITGKTYITFVFSTAWSFAYPVIKKLEIMGYDMDIRYADEDYGSNCGKLTYTREQGWTHCDESRLTNPERFAREIWNKY